MGTELKYTCDRCDVFVCRKPMAPKPDALPDGWNWVQGKLICNKCSGDLQQFLRGARIEYVQVNHEGASPDDRKGQ